MMIHYTFNYSCSEHLIFTSYIFIPELNGDNIYCRLFCYVLLHKIDLRGCEQDEHFMSSCQEAEITRDTQIELPSHLASRSLRGRSDKFFIAEWILVIHRHGACLHFIIVIKLTNKIV